MSSAIEQFTPTIYQITNVQQIPCPQMDCTSIFSNSGQLDMHLTRHHKLPANPPAATPAQRQYFCPIDTCKYYLHQTATTQRVQFFGSMKLLKQHYMKMHAVRSLACPQCSRTFAVERLLRAHRQQCGQTFSCTQCSWPYQTLEALQTHCRRKGHPLPERKLPAPTPPPPPSSSTALHSGSTGDLMRDLSELVRMKPAEQRRRLVRIAPKTVDTRVSTSAQADLITQSSQTTQIPEHLYCARPDPIDSIFLNHWQKRVDKNADQPLSPAAVNTNHCSVQTEINLNNLHYLNVALDSMTGFCHSPAGAAAAENLCHIETQTDFDRVAAELHTPPVTTTSTTTNVSTSGDHEQHDDDVLCQLAEASSSPAMMYTDGHTQTQCDELMFGGWTHIETQTCWSPQPHGTEDFSEFLVSTETQTSLPP